MRSTEWLGRPGRTPAGRALRRSAATGRRGPGPGHRPDLILADEPTGNLDSRRPRDVLGLMDELHDAGGPWS